MSLEYYLYCRREYDDIICYIDVIIEKYETISDISIKENNLCHDHYESFNREDIKNFFIQKRDYIKELKQICNKKIMRLCKHDFVTDLIDLSPDNSQYIKYCKICEYTEN